MKDRRRENLLRSMAEDLSILVNGTEQAEVLRCLEPRGQSLATKAVEKLLEYSAGWPAGGSGEGGATNIVAEFKEGCPECGGVGKIRGPQEFGLQEPYLECSRCEGIGWYNITLTVPQHPDRTGEQVASEAEERFVAPSVLDSHLQAAAGHLKAAADISAHAVVPVNAAPAKARDDTDDWCASCARVTDHKGRAFMVPSRVANGSVSRTPEGTIGGAKGTPLCDWCYGWVLAEKAWPAPGLIEARKDGRRITSKVLTRVLGRNSPITKAAPV